MQREAECTEVELLIEHNWGKGWMPVESWIELGPAECPSGAAPVAARCSDGHELRLRDVLPLKYRNNLLSYTLIKLGFLSNPWSQFQNGS